MSVRFMPARRVLLTLSAVLATLAAFVVVPAWATAAPAPPTVTYTNTQTIPVPPASSYAGSAGGDGWSLAFSATNVYNVFHHQGTLQVACHLQSDASACYPAVTVTDASSHNFATSGHPGMFLDGASSKLYVYATRDDDTAGVVCFDTAHATTAPFCGFTALTAVGHGQIDSISSLSEPVVVGSKFYAFNYFSTAGFTADQNAMLCFDLSTFAACAGQPFAVPFTPGTTQVDNFPEPSVADIGGRIIVSTVTNDGTNTHEELSCFNAATGGGCAGTWPVAAPAGYIAGQEGQGAPFPLLSASGSLRGFCLPTGTDQCFDLTGASVATPSGLPAAVNASSPWNGTGVVIGPRVYVPNGESDQVDCYDASTNASCANFPKALDNLELAYTATLDPQRPTCIWVNADGGSSQIQNFDAFTGGGCGQGPIRVLASSFVVNAPACTPGSYSSLTVGSPKPGTYTSGSVQFLDGDATQLPGVANRPIDPATGAVDLSGLNLASASGLPQFLITLTGFAGQPGAVTVTLVWSGTQDPDCIKSGTTVTNGKTPTRVALTLNRSSFTAKVTAVPAGAVRPTGRVTFSVAGKVVGSAPLVAGTATLRNLSPKLKYGEVTASYGGSSDFLPSSTSVVRRNPKITATLTSPKPRSASGWFRGPVTVTLHCVTSGAALTAPCPGRVVLHNSGRGQLVSRTITATDGGTATARVKVSIDRHVPDVRVGGVSQTVTYRRPPAGRCVASDSLSGVASCRLTRRVSGHKITYVATAVDRAGNTATQRLDAKLR